MKRVEKEVVYFTVLQIDNFIPFIVSPCIFVHLVLSPTYALIYFSAT